MGVLSPTFRKKREGQSVLEPAVLQVPLAQNNPYTKVAFLGVAYSETFQGLRD